MKNQEPQTIFRLIDVQEKNSAYTLTVQVIGKSSTFVTTPEEVLTDTKLMEHFSSYDIRTITYYACKMDSAPKNKIVSKKFSTKIGKILFGMKSLRTKSIEEKTASEISLDKNMIKGLSPEDAHLIGYVASHEMHQQLDDCKKELKRKKFKP